ncbi:hypothetical protein HYX18_02740 [Candidatus Woesearchaeota archaeon]|nr:hypothetical protein [Candidatus Woesearchaeota archaeon]
MKKGFSYVDVSISVGIFLVALIIAFVLIKPAIKQENISTILLPVVRYGFENATFWTIYRHPIFLSSSYNSQATYEIEVPFNYNSKNVNLTDINMDYIPFSYESGTSQRPTFNVSILALIISSSKTTYYLLYSDDYNYEYQTSIFQSDVSYTLYTYNFGVREEIKGISTDKFKKLSSYEDLKKQFKFPSNNDFSISLYDTLNRNLILSYSYATPAKDKAVYSLQYTSFILYENSTRMPVLVAINVW